MPAIKVGNGTKSGKKLVKKKPVSKPRTAQRVTEEEKAFQTAKSAAHRDIETPVMATARLLTGDEVLIAAQLSEIVPVTSYGNVTLGPNMIAWKLDGADMNALADVDWDSKEQLTNSQQAAYDRVMGALKATSRILEVHNSDDREAVEESVRKHNEREASEAAEKKKPRRR